MLAHYPAGRIVPFALLVPVVGMIAALVIFTEPLSPVEIFGAWLVMAGLSVNVFGERVLARRLRRIG